MTEDQKAIVDSVADLLRRRFSNLRILFSSEPPYDGGLIEVTFGCFHEATTHFYYFDSDGTFVTLGSDAMLSHDVADPHFYNG